MGFYVRSDHRPPNSFNVQGYGETRKLAEINRRIVSIFGGSTLLPNRMPEAWEDDDRLASLHEMAANLVSDMDKHGSWALKNDPVTLPFWKRFLPSGHSYVICIRNPLASVQSQVSALGATERGAALVWFHRNLAAIRNTQGARRVFLFYEDYFDRDSDQVGKLAAFVGKDTAGTLRVSPDLRHYGFSLEDCLCSEKLPIETKLLYLSVLRIKDDDGFADTFSRISDAGTVSNDPIGRLELESKIEYYEKTVSHPYVRLGLSMRGALRRLGV